MHPRNIAIFVAVAVGIVAFNTFNVDELLDGPPEPVEPDWAAITDWPGSVAADVEAQPDPNRVFTVIVLDDSGSMGGDIEPAKRAVIEAVNAHVANGPGGGHRAQ